MVENNPIEEFVGGTNSVGIENSLLSLLKNRWISSISKKNLLDIINDDLNFTNWESIKELSEEDSIILLNNELDIIEVALEMAMDNETKVDSWIEKKLISKPTQEQLDVWEVNKSKSFLNVSISAANVLIVFK